MPTAERVPPEGDVQDFIDRLYAYVDAVIPSWSASVSGASEDELQRLSELAGLDAAGLALPEFYRRWAAALGRNDGRLLSETLRAWTSVAEMIELYEERHRFEPELIEPRLPVVMSRKIGDDFSLDLRTPELEPSVRETSGVDDLGLFAASWEAMVFQCAIETCERRRFAGLRIYSSSPAGVREAIAKSEYEQVAELLAETLRGLGLTLPWTNDPRHVYGLGDAASVLVNVGLAGAAPVVIVGDDPKRMRELGEVVAAAISGQPAALDQWR